MVSKMETQKDAAKDEQEERPEPIFHVGDRPGPVFHVGDQGIASPGPIVATTDIDLPSALGGESATRSNTEPSEEDEY